MTERVLPLVFTFGDRAVCHVLDPATPTREVLALIALYFTPEETPAGALVWESANGDLALDPARPIGEQVPPDALIRINAG